MEMLIPLPIRTLDLMIGRIIPHVGIRLVQVAIIRGLCAALFSVTTAGFLGTLPVVKLLFILAILSLGLVPSTLATSLLQVMQMIRGVVLRHAELADQGPDAVWLLGFALLGLIVASLRYRKRLD